MVDLITSFIASLDIASLTEISKFFDTYTYPLLFFIWILLAIHYVREMKIKMKMEKTKKTKTREQREQWEEQWKERQNFVFRKQIIVLLLSAIIVTCVVSVLKSVYNVPRPCFGNDGLQSKIPCPSDESFPSGHATATAMFIPAFLGMEVFPFYLVFYLIVAFSRIYLGVHTFTDVIAGSLIGIVVYFISDLIVNRNDSFFEYGGKEKGRLPLKKEIARQFFHMLFGIGVLMMYYYFNAAGMAEIINICLFIGFVAGLYLLSLKLSRKEIPLVDGLLKEMERPSTIQGYGSFWYVIGLLFILSFLNNPLEVMAAVFIMSVSDGVSTLIGRYGKRRLFYNKKKTLEGSVAFFLCSLFTYPILGPISIILALLATIVESIPILDDNITLPIAMIIFFSCCNVIVS